MVNITREHIAHLYNRGQQASRRLDALRDRLTGVTRKAVGTLETAAAAGVGGLIQGRAGAEGSHILHVPTDLGLGLVLNVLGYFNAAGDYSEHLNNVGDGFLASFTSSVGFGWGAAWRETGKFSFGKPGAGGGGALPPGPATKSSGEIPAAQMADIVARVRAAAAGAA